MKTFEERYTAWIDGQLTGEALTAFEQELARRAEAGDAEADKSQALGLRALLKEHLQAPVLHNSEFFSHQMRERIDAEIDRAALRREAAAKPAWRLPSFAWPFAQAAGAGLACLFVAGALYYGTRPPRQTEAPAVAVVASPAPQVPATGGTPADAVAPVSQVPDNRPKGDGTLAFQNVPTPAPIDLNSGEDIHVVQPNPASTTSATTLHYDKASVLWVNNPPYLSSVGLVAPSPAPAVSGTPAPAPSSAPSAAP